MTEKSNQSGFAESNFLKTSPSRSSTTLSVSSLADSLASAALTRPSRPKKAPELPIHERRNWLIHLHYTRKEFAECKAVIKEVLAESSGHCDYALYVQAMILRLEGNIQQSLELFERCTILNPRNVDAFKQVARSLFLLAKHKNALDVYTGIEHLVPNDWEIMHNKGVCCMHLKQYDRAKEFLNQAIACKGSNAELSYVILAKIALCEGNVTSAIGLYQKALEVSPENLEHLSTIGLLYMQLGRYREAFDCLGRALAFDPTYAKAILAAGTMMQVHADYDVALTKYRIASKETPESGPLWNNIGMCFFGKKKYIAAVSCLKRATYFSPFEWKINYNLGLVHCYMRQFASAFHFLNAANSFRPRNAQILSLLAYVLTQLDDVSNAKTAYEQAIKCDPKDAMIQLNYAIYLYNSNDSSAAARQYSDTQQLIRQLEGQYQQLQDSNQAKSSTIDKEVLDTAKKLENLLKLSDKKPVTNKEPAANMNEEPAT